MAGHLCRIVRATLLSVTLMALLGAVTHSHAASTLVNVTTTSSNYLPLTPPPTSGITISALTRVCFSVRACRDAYILLSDDDGNRMFVINIGGWGNTKSYILNVVPDESFIVVTPTPLSCSEFRWFYVSWVEGVVQVVALRGAGEEDGGGGEGVVLVEYNSGMTSLPVSRLSVASKDGIQGVWRVDFQCLGLLPKSTTASETTSPQTSAATDHEVSTDMTVTHSDAVSTLVSETTTGFNYVPLTPTRTSGITISALTSFCFSVRACDNAHVLLSDANNEDLYEIVIGGWDNSVSVIRFRHSATNLVSVDTPEPLNCNEFRWFYVGWAEGVVQVVALSGAGEEDGGGGGEGMLMEYDGGLTSLPVSRLSVTGWHSATVAWRVDFQCLVQQPDSTTPSDTTSPQTSTGSVTNLLASALINVTTDGDRTFVPLTPPPASGVTISALTRFCFSVQSCHNAVVLLSADGDPDLYEILIGGWSNTKARVTKQTRAMVTVDASQPLNCNEFRWFYVGWAEGVVQAVALRGAGEEDGGGGEEVVLVRYDSGMTSPPINRLSVAGWHSSPGVWRVDFQCLGLTSKSTTASDTTSPPTTASTEPEVSTDMTTGTHSPAGTLVTLTSLGNYTYLPLTPPPTSGITISALTRFCFSVRACRAAFVLLSDADNGDLYEILIGGWGNSKSLIRTSKGGTAVSSVTGGQPLNCNEFRWFYVSWAEGVVQAVALRGAGEEDGGGGEEVVLIEYNSGLTSLPVSRLSVAGWGGTEGVWRVDFQCLALSTESTTLSETTSPQTSDAPDHEVSTDMTTTPLSSAEPAAREAISQTTPQPGSWAGAGVRTTQQPTPTPSLPTPARRPPPLCACRCLLQPPPPPSNMTLPADQQDAAETARQRFSHLVVPSNGTATAKRRKTSAVDERGSSTTIGFAGVVFLCLPFVVIVGLDLLPVLCYLKRFIPKKG